MCEPLNNNLIINKLIIKIIIIKSLIWIMGLSGAMGDEEAKSVGSSAIDYITLEYIKTKLFIEY